MSVSVWHWSPSSIGRADEFSTIVLRYDSGYMHRRPRRSKPLRKFSLVYSGGRLTPTEEKEVQDFIIARLGAYDSFYLPSFEEKLGSKVKEAYSGGTTLKVDDSSVFSATEGVRGNRIFLRNAVGESEVETIAAIPDANTLTLDSVLTYDYNVGDLVYVAYTVRLTSDLSQVSIPSKRIREITVDMEEVF